MDPRHLFEVLAEMAASVVAGLGQPLHQGNRAGAFRTKSPLMSSSLLAGKTMCATYVSTSCCASGIAPGLRGESRARYRAPVRWG
jgi:hypothetical protein